MLLTRAGVFSAPNSSSIIGSSLGAVSAFNDSIDFEDALRRRRDSEDDETILFHGYIDFEDEEAGRATISSLAGASFTIVLMLPVLMSPSFASSW